MQKLGNSTLRIQIAGMDTQQSDAIKSELAKDFKVDPERIASATVGPTPDTDRKCSKSSRSAGSAKP